MKQRIVAFCAAIALTVGLLFSCLPATVASEGYPLSSDVTLYAESAILVSLAGEPEQDMVLYAKNPDEVRSPGGMMRYMVMAYALHRIEEQGLNIDTHTGSLTSELHSKYVSGTNVNEAGMKDYGRGTYETWTLRDLLSVSFLHSASDAVVVLAVAIDGSVEAFVDGMNQLATELGCTNSHFHQLNGKESISQYTTPRDMYRILRYCQSFSEFEDLASPWKVEVTPVTGSKKSLWSDNKLIVPSSDYYYSPLVFSRVSSTADGNHCAAVARKGGYEYLVVVMGSPQADENGNGGVHYRDTTALFKWAFSDFEYRIVLGKDEILRTLKVKQSMDVDRVSLVPEKEIATVVKKDIPNNVIRPEITLTETTLTAPIKKGTVYGKVELYVNNDQKIGEVALVAAEDISQSKLLHTWDNFTTGLSKIFGTVVPYVLIGVGGLVLLIGVYIAVSVVHNRNRQKQKYADFKPRKKRLPNDKE